MCLVGMDYRLDLCWVFCWHSEDFTLHQHVFQMQAVFEIEDFGVKHNLMGKKHPWLNNAFWELQSSGNVVFCLHKNYRWVQQMFCQFSDRQLYSRNSPEPEDDDLFSQIMLSCSIPCHASVKKCLFAVDQTRLDSAGAFLHKSCEVATTKAQFID